MDNYITHATIRLAVFFLVTLSILSACIVIVIKKKTTFSKLLLTGGILMFISYLVVSTLNIIVITGQDTLGQKDIKNMFDLQYIASYIEAIIYLFFGLILLLFAIKDLKKQN